MSGTLYLVATPIGNLADITHRALQILKDVDLIACEDTRHTHKLLQHYGITTKTVSYHEHNEQQRTPQLVDQLKQGSDIAVVSDAGTPSISDPGYRLVRAAIENGVAVVPVPGPSALISALIAAGLPTDEFFFAGFLPSRTNARRTRLSELRTVPGTLIFYEAPHRLATTLKDAYEILGERDAVVARELTKLHEEIKRGRLSELASYFEDGDKARGEIVLLIDRNVIADTTVKTESSIAALVDRFEEEGMDHRAALKKAARELGLSRAEAYRKLLATKSPK
ncbi:MAG TPA: 16S rRNA (cytidine(1402)-2'-O)-methyltransferase [Pyrinomonadaceae bacterium]|nr:16S rRNA (cytidine(1402)-2'-O)-methyltransferase [Pyrinomonadaceae bacterium]